MNSNHVKHHNYYYYNHFTAPWTLFGTTRVSRYQKGKTSKVKPIWIYWPDALLATQPTVSKHWRQSEAPQIQNIALEKACNRGMTFKDTHYNCCYLGIISWQKIHIDYRSNSYRDIAISCDPETERESKWEWWSSGGRSKNERLGKGLGGHLTGDAASPWVVWPTVGGAASPVRRPPMETAVTASPPLPPHPPGVAGRVWDSRRWRPCNEVGEHLNRQHISYIVTRTPPPYMWTSVSCITLRCGPLE